MFNPRFNPLNPPARKFRNGFTLTCLNLKTSRTETWQSISIKSSGGSLLVMSAIAGSESSGKRGKERCRVVPVVGREQPFRADRQMSTVRSVSSPVLRLFSLSFFVLFRFSFLPLTTPAHLFVRYPPSLLVVNHHKLFFRADHSNCHGHKARPHYRRLHAPPPLPRSYLASRRRKQVPMTEEA